MKKLAPIYIYLHYALETFSNNSVAMGLPIMAHVLVAKLS